MKINLKALREQRNQRLAAAKRAVQQSASGFEVLNLEVLPEKVELIDPPKDGSIEYQMRLLQFQVANANNCEQTPVGTMVVSRSYAYHSYVGPGDRTILCPRTWGRRCPICEYYLSFDKDVRTKDKALYRFRAREFSIFNALLYGKTSSGKIGRKPVVFRAGTFSGITSIYKEVNRQAGIKKDDSLYLFADLIEGFDIEALWAKEALAKGGIEFGQLVKVNLKPETKCEIDERILPFIVNLDDLIPEPMTAEEIDALLDGQLPATEKTVSPAPSASFDDGFLDDEHDGPESPAEEKHEDDGGFIEDEPEKPAPPKPQPAAKKEAQPEKSARKLTDDAFVEEKVEEPVTEEHDDAGDDSGDAFFEGF